MPYISQKNRQALDEHIDKLADEIKKAASKDGNKAAFSGFLNYCCTRLALRTIPVR